MNNENLQKTLEDFSNLNNTDEKAILIDGRWGSGKTYQISKFIKSNKKSKLKIVYVSLFGKESISEINSEIYLQTHRKSSKITKTLVFIGKLASGIDYASGISEALDYALSNKKSKMKIKCLIIFDDLERMSNKISYLDLMGYFNNLFLYGVKIICICSSKNMDDKIQQEFSEFREKVFDHYYALNPSNLEIMHEIFGDNISDPLINLFNGNIRIMHKTYNLYNSIKDYCETNKIDSSKTLADDQLVIACCFAINAVLNRNFSNSISYQSEEDFNELNQKYGEIIAKNLIGIYKKYPKIDSTLEMYIEYCVDAFVSKDFNGLAKCFKQAKTTEEQNIFDKEMYLLSTKNKIIYGDAFIEKATTHRIDFNDYDNVQTLYDVICYYPNKINDNTITSLAQSIVDSYKGNDIEYRFDNTKLIPNNNLAKISVERFKFLLKEVVRLHVIYENNKCYETFHSFSIKKDYVGMRNALYNINLTISNKEFYKILSENDFFIPSIDEDVGMAEWSYCNEAARFARQTNLDNEFVQVLQKRFDESKDKLSVFDRCAALIYTELDNQKLGDEFIERNKKYVGTSD